MGGLSSSRWGSYVRRTRVEECLALDVNQLRRDGLIHGGSRDELIQRNFKTNGRLKWTNPSGEVEGGSYRLERAEEGEGLVFRLLYEIDKESVDLSIPLETTEPKMGGVRWWFTCPLHRVGPCGRRVAKLYLPPDERYFGCRTCYDLTYQSCQESRSFDSLFRYMAANSGESFSEVKGYFMRLRRFRRRFGV